MAKGMYHYLKEAWRSPDQNRIRTLMIDWRQGDTIVKLEKPTRLDRARALGYKAKKGFVVARIRIERGGRKRPRPNKARKGRKQTNKKVLKMSYQWVAEGRVQRKFKNLEVLNSYNLGKDGIYYFYEVILVDPNRAEIKNDKTINWICTPANRNRVLRGLTGAGKKSRGLTSKSPMNKNRPSVSAGSKRGK